MVNIITVLAISLLFTSILMKVPLSYVICSDKLVVLQSGDSGVIEYNMSNLRTPRGACHLIIAAEPGVISFRGVSDIRCLDGSRELMIADVVVCLNRRGSYHVMINHTITIKVQKNVHPVFMLRYKYSGKPVNGRVIR